MANTQKSTANKKILYYYTCPDCHEETLSFDLLTADGSSRSYPRAYGKKNRETQKERMIREARKSASEALFEKEQFYLERINHQRNLYGLTMHAACAKCQKPPIWTWFTPTSISRSGLLTTIMCFIFGILKSSTYDRRTCSLIFAAGTIPAVVCFLYEGLKRFMAQRKLDRLGEAYYPAMLTADVASQFIEAKKAGRPYQIPDLAAHKNPLVNAGNLLLTMLAHIFLVSGWMLSFSGIAYGFDTASFLTCYISPGHLLIITGAVLLLAGIILEYRHFKHTKAGGF